MGLFDRIKKALTGEDTSTEEEQETVNPAQTEVESTDSTATVEPAGEAEVDSDKTAVSHETVVPVDKEPVEQQEATVDTATKEPAELKEEDTEQLYEQGLQKTSQSFGARLNAFFAKFRSVDENFFEELEEVLIESDVGYETAMQLSDSLRTEVKLRNAKSKNELQTAIVQKMVELYEAGGAGKNEELQVTETGSTTVYLFVGVNGAGKTTTVGKLAAKLHGAGKSVLLVAADTFRAGAVAQLVEWGKRVDVPVVRGKEQADPAAVVFDGVQRAKDENFDYVLIDTAGRLQNKVNLMNELEKIERTIKKVLPDQPTEVLLVVDGSTGQNALIQAKEFNETTKLTGLVLTKIDGSSKGGVVLAIRNEMQLPVKLVGLGEKVTDLAEFDAEKFAIGLFRGLM